MKTYKNFLVIKLIKNVYLRENFSSDSMQLVGILLTSNIGHEWPCYREWIFEQKSDELIGNSCWLKKEDNNIRLGFLFDDTDEETEDNTIVMTQEQYLSLYDNWVNMTRAKCDEIIITRDEDGNFHFEGYCNTEDGQKKITALSALDTIKISEAYARELHDAAPPAAEPNTATNWVIASLLAAPISNNWPSSQEWIFDGNSCELTGDGFWLTKKNNTIVIGALHDDGTKQTDTHTITMSIEQYFNYRNAPDPMNAVSVISDNTGNFYLNRITD